MSCISRWAKEGINDDQIRFIESMGYPREQWMIDESYEPKTNAVPPEVAEGNSSAPSFGHTQDASVFSAAVTKEQYAAIKAGVTLDDALKVFAQGDERVIRTVSTLLNALADTSMVRVENQRLKESTQKLNNKVRKLESEIGDLNNELEGLVETVKRIAERDIPPQSIEERRRCMTDITQLIKQSQERLNHRAMPENVIEDKGLRITED